MILSTLLNKVLSTLMKELKHKESLLAILTIFHLQINFILTTTSRPKTKMQAITKKAAM